MTAMESLRNTVETALLAWAARPEGAAAARMSVAEEPVCALRRAGVSTAPENGVRYQRCGGGRRVIRRSRGE